MKHQTASSVTPAGGGANITGSRAPYHLPCDSNSGGGAAVASPPVPDEMPGSAGADEMVGQLIDFDLTPFDPEDDSDPRAFPRSRRLICSTSSDGQTTIHRFGDGGGLVLTAEETRQVYEFMAQTARIWGAVL